MKGAVSTWPFYRVWRDAIRTFMSKDEQLAFYDAMMDYLVDGIEPAFDGDLANVFDLFRDDIDDFRALVGIATE